MSDLSVPSANGVQTPSGCNPRTPTPTTPEDTGLTGSKLSRRINLLPIAATPGPIPRGRSNRSLRASASLASTVPS
jgi:hypothetical protein